jgi:CheY-like chemotaxis protein
MALTIPVFQRPGCVVFLDDDPDYLDMLCMVLPERWHAELFSRPSRFFQRMRDEPDRWEADAAAQLQMIDRWHQGHPLLPQILHYWANTPSRYALVKTCVIDYAMPGTNGLQVLSTLLDWPGSRVLLTGQADEQVAVKAFNTGLIDQYVPKQAPDITRQLLDALRKLSLAAHPRLNTLWHAALQPAQQMLLQVPSVAKALRAHTERYWVEYVVLGEPFGLLGLTAAGECHWLQLETTQGLHDLAEMASSAGLDFDLVRSIESGEQLAAIELHQQLGLAGQVRTAPTISMGNDGALHAASFVLTAADLRQPIAPYSDFLAANQVRIIQDD